MFLDPYLKTGDWKRGNLHTHSTVSDGSFNSREVAHIYGDVAGYDFIAMTDHTGSQKVKPQNYMAEEDIFCEKKKDFICLMGREESGGRHLIGVNVSMPLGENFIPKPREEYTLSDYQTLLDRIKQEGGFTIMCHPHWSLEDYWTSPAILSLQGCDAIEIVNGDVENGSGNLATDVWDEVLSAGNRIWGVGNDDFHHVQCFQNAWNVVKTAEWSKQGIMDALFHGSFYASTGAYFENLYAEGNQIVAECSRNSMYEKCTKVFQFIGEGGKVLQTQIGKSGRAVYTANGSEKYVRVELMLEMGGTAFSQPFFSELF